MKCRAGVGRVFSVALAIAAVAACASRAGRAQAGEGAKAAESKVRPAARAGQWYPAGAADLERAVRGYLEAANPKPPEGRLAALIVPHAGYAFSGRTAAFAYKLVGKGRFTRVIMLGPSHFSAFRGACIADADFFETPLGRVPVDTAVRDALLRSGLVVSDAAAHRPEHALEAQIPFLQTALGDGWSLVPILCGRMEPGEPEALAALLKKHIDDRTLVVASSDFTHYGADYGYTPFRDDIAQNVRKLDMGAVKDILAKDGKAFRRYVADTGATICGRTPIEVLLALLPRDARGELLHYTTSSAVTGDESTSVSYVAIAFGVPAAAESGAAAADEMLTADEQHMLLVLARRTLETFVRTGRKLPVKVEDLPRRLQTRCGVFVTLRKHGDLRGCIGYVTGRVALAEGVRDNAVNAASEDPRFGPVKPEELKDIDIEISVLTPLRPVADPTKIVVGRDGLLIQKGMRQGLLLPQVATELHCTREQFLDLTCRKAGLEPGAWRDAALYSFTAQVFGEKDEAEDEEP